MIVFTADDGSTIGLEFDGDLLITRYNVGTAHGQIRTRGPVSTAIIDALRVIALKQAAPMGMVNDGEPT